MPSKTCKSYSIFSLMFFLSCASIIGMVLLHLYVKSDPEFPPPVETDLVDYVILNAIVWLGSGNYTEAIAIKDGRIYDVGDSVNISRRYQRDNVKVIDAEKGLVLPGFIESHAHTISSGFFLTDKRVQLRGVNSNGLFVAKIVEYINTINVKPGDWVLGGNWDNHTIGALPRKEWIDDVTRNNPVFVTRLDGHMGLANSLALEMAGINATSPDNPFGGVIERDENGEPTGILKDNAMNLVTQKIPNPTDQEKDEALQKAMEYFAENGITSVHNMGTFDDLAVFQRAKDNNNLRVRFYAAVPLQEVEELITYVEKDGYGDDFLKWGSLKGYIDGSLGAETALMFEPYLDDPNNTGLFVNTPENLTEWTRRADIANLQVCIHAIGDRANNIVLNIYKNISSTAPNKDRRFRIEHAQHVMFEDIPLFTQNNVIASIQPYHIIDDGNWAQSLIGPVRANYTYPLQSFLTGNVKLAFGSDWDVAPASPVQGLYAAVTRATTNGANPNGWIPNQKISLESALLAYTSGSAYAEFAETSKGKIERYYLADLVILDRNIFDPNFLPTELWNVQVKYTMVNGTVTYSNNPEKLQFL